MLTRLHMKIQTNSADDSSVLVMNDGYLEHIRLNPVHSRRR